MNSDQTREALNDAIQEYRGDPDWYLDLLAEHERAIRAEAWDEAIDACAEQGTIQTPINPYRKERA